MEIKTVDNKETWDKFFNENGSPSFLQSWEWGEFQKAIGDDVIYLGLHEQALLVAIALVIKVRAKRGDFLFIPYGPIIVQSEKFPTSSPQEGTTLGAGKIQSYLEPIVKYLINIAKQEGFDFIRVAPILNDVVDNQKLFKDLGFKKAPIYMHAERMWVLSLDKTEEDLLAGMRKTTRYLVKKASREGVVIEKSTDNQAVDDFWKIYEITAQRENFHPFSRKFIREEFNVFNKSNNCLFFTAKHQNQILASALIIFTASTAFYHQGASIHTKIPAPYLLQWEAIKEAKRRGCRFYNFWGILQEGRTPKAWAGLTLFKTGFGGSQIDYLPTQDLVLSSKYYLTYLYEKFLAWRRGV